MPEVPSRIGGFEVAGVRTRLIEAEQFPQHGVLSRALSVKDPNAQAAGGAPNCSDGWS